MVRTRQDPQDKAVIAFLAQTGQKAGALIAMKWKFIHIVDERGVVHVKPEEFKNRKGELAYLSKDEYVFIMGRDVMGLLGKAPKDKEKWLFDISERTISRIVKKAAEDAGIEERVTPNTFRGYWRAQMAKGGVWQDTLLEYMMGYQIPRRETRSGYLSWQNLLEEYRKDESRLEV